MLEYTQLPTNINSENREDLESAIAPNNTEKYKHLKCPLILVAISVSIAVLSVSGVICYLLLKPTENRLESVMTLNTTNITSSSGRCRGMIMSNSNIRGGVWYFEYGMGSLTAHTDTYALDGSPIYTYLFTDLAYSNAKYMCRFVVKYNGNYLAGTSVSYTTLSTPKLKIDQPTFDGDNQPTFTGMVNASTYEALYCEFSFWYIVSSYEMKTELAPVPSPYFTGSAQNKLTECTSFHARGYCQYHQQTTIKYPSPTIYFTSPGAGKYNCTD
jgi:hypothetical protein